MSSRPVRSIIGALLMAILVACGGSGGPASGETADIGGDPKDHGAGVQDAGVQDGGVQNGGVQDGGPCTHQGVDYADCYIGLSWTGAQQRYLSVERVLLLDSSISDVKDGPCLLLRGVRSFDVFNLTIDGCDQSGIRVSNRTDSHDVRIVGGSVEQTGRRSESNGSCINAGVTAGVVHSGLIIDGVELDGCGFNELDHGIYVQSPGFVIRNVTVGETSGNGISIRSSGLVEGNTIRGPVAKGKAAIRYFNDHPCEPDGTVRILNNRSTVGAETDGVDISLLWSEGDDDLACSNYELTGNGPAEVTVYQVVDRYLPYEVVLQE